MKLMHARRGGGEPVQQAEGSEVRLIGRLDERRWLGEWHGRTVVAQWAAYRYPGAYPGAHPGAADVSIGTSDGTGQYGLLLARSASLVAVTSPRLVPVLGVGSSDDGWWLLTEQAEGVPLARLRALCDLSSGQAGAVAYAALLALAALHEAEEVHGRLDEQELLVGPDGRLDEQELLVGPDGRLRLRGWGLATLTSDDPGHLGELRAADQRAAAELAVTLVAASRLSASAGWTGERRDEVTAELSAAAALAWDEAQPLLAERLTALAGPPGRAERVRLELAALVQAVPRSDGSSDPREPPQPQRPAPAGRRRPVAPRGGRPVVVRRTTDRSWVWKSIAALCALAAVAGLELGFLGDRIVQDLRSLRSPAAAARASAAAQRTPPALPSLGPASARPVSGVTVRTLRPCTARHACTVVVVLRLQPSSRAYRLSWHPVAIDRCASRAHPLPGGPVTIAAHARTARAVRTVTLPNARMLGLGAIVTSPVRVASAPLPLSGKSC